MLRDRTAIVSSFVDIRQQICTLRNKFEETLSDLRALADDNPEDEDLEDMHTRVTDVFDNLENVESGMDEEFDLETYPSPDPKTWSE